MPKCPCCNVDSSILFDGKCPKCKEDEIASIIDELQKAVENIRRAADSCEKARNIYHERVKNDIEYAQYFLSANENYFKNAQKQFEKIRNIEQEFINLMFPDSLDFSLSIAKARSGGDSSPGEGRAKGDNDRDRS